ALGASSGPAAGPIVVSGSGFAAHQTVTIRWEGASGPALASVAADATGAFANQVVIIPSDATAGVHQIFASDGSASSTANVTVTASAGISLSVVTGMAGSMVTITGANFVSNSTATFHWDSISGAVLGVATADSAGAFGAVTITLPTGATAGAHAIFV